MLGLCALEVPEFRTVATGRLARWACACPGTCAVHYAPALLVLCRGDLASVLPAPALSDSSKSVASLVPVRRQRGQRTYS
jgi:hypothetical protein